MDMEKVRLQLISVSRMLDSIPVVGKESRNKLTYGVDYLENLANSLVQSEAAHAPDAEKDVVTDEHDCAES